MQSVNESYVDEPFAPLVSPQLQAIIATEVARQTEPLINEIAALEATNTALVDRLAALEGLSAPPVDGTAEEGRSPQQATSSPETGLLEEVIRIRTDLEGLNESRALEIAEDRRRIAALEVPEVVRPQPKQCNQGDILRVLLASTANGKMLQSTARDKMGISKSAFSRLLQTLKGSVKHEPYHRDRRQNVLILINKKP